MTTARLPRYIDDSLTAIDILLTLPGIGEVPYTAREYDPEPQGRAIFAAAAAGEFGEVEVYVPPVPSDDQIAATLTRVVQLHLDGAAQARGYDNILSACSYAAVENAFQAEGAAFLAWRAACWVHCQSVLTDCQEGLRPIPAAADLVAELPALVLP